VQLEIFHVRILYFFETNDLLAIEFFIGAMGSNRHVTQAL
jgi:hypothetical protein